MEYNFQDWNRNMRIRLEIYFRWTIAITVAYILQNIMIIAFFYSDLKIAPIVTTIGSGFFLILDSFFSYKLLNIKIRDMRREWKR